MASTPVRPQLGPTGPSHDPPPFERQAPALRTVGASYAPVDLSLLIDGPLGSGEIGWLAHYRVLKVLGQGGMGVVLKAEDTHLQREVALKVMLPAWAAQATARDRFIREARAAARVNSDHVVTIHHVGVHADVPYIVMELLRGHTLTDLLQSGYRPSLAETLRIGRETAEGLAAAHETGLVHRDVKPANIWVEPTGRVKILDFGLARPSEGRTGLTLIGNIVGTPEFMSPEQARGQIVDARCDLFSLGAVLYCLCTGELPFQGESLMALLTALAVDPPRPIEDLNGEVPAALISLIMQLLEKDREARPASAREVVEALKAIERELVWDDMTLPPRDTLPLRADSLAGAARRQRLGRLFVVASLLVMAISLGVALAYHEAKSQPSPTSAEEKQTKTQD
jgi:serine/threonine protein kinase